jgi:hypothetical protein
VPTLLILPTIPEISVSFGIAARATKKIAPVSFTGMTCHPATDGTGRTIAVPLTGCPNRFNLSESVFVIVLHLVVPLFCLLPGQRVALARPPPRQDQHARRREVQQRLFPQIVPSIPSASRELRYVNGGHNAPMIIH